MGFVFRKYGLIAFTVTWAALLGALPLRAGQVVLNHPDHPVVHSNSLDQPRLDAVLTRNGEVVEDMMYNAWTGEMEMMPAVFRAFIDTGASGFAISNLHVGENDHDDIPSFHFTGGEFLGEYTNLGLGGEEIGDVVGEFGLRIRNGPVDPFGMAAEFIEEFVPYEDDFRLWSRRAPGVGEVNEIDMGDWIYELTSPINIIGMPVIEQRVMVMNWVRNELLEESFPDARELQTHLLDKGDGEIPETNVTLDLEMRDFVGDPASGEMNPTSSRNPLVKDVTITHDPERDSVTGDWLFDTGAGASFISFDWAQAIGLIPGEFEDLESYVVVHEDAGGIVSQVGGIGPDIVTVPVLELNELRVPAREGFDLVWQNVRLLVFEHEELAELDLEGIFGMNLVGPSVTLDASVFDGVNVSDPELLLMFFEDISPPPVTSMVFEVTGESTGELRFATNRVNSSYDTWRAAYFSEAELEDASVSGDEADPGGYGIPNLLRFAFAMDAREPQRERLPEPLYSPDNDEGDSPVSLWFDRPRDVSGIEYRVDASEDLDNWTQLEAEWHVRETFPDRERVEVRVPRSSAEATGDFFRIRVVRE